MLDSKGRLHPNILRQIKKIEILGTFKFLTRIYSRIPHWHVHINKTQVSYIFDKNILTVDKLLRFENLKQDFIDLEKNFDLPPAELPLANTANKRKYWRLYLEGRSDVIAHINEKFEKDFILLNYEMIDSI